MLVVLQTLNGHIQHNNTLGAEDVDENDIYIIHDILNRTTQMTFCAKATEMNAQNHKQIWFKSRSLYDYSAPHLKSSSSYLEL